MEMVAVDGLPFSFVDNPGFRQFLSVVCPQYRPISRTTISRSLLPQMYEEYKIRIKQILSKVCFAFLIMAFRSVM